VGLDSSVNLLVASLDLQLVRLLRSAIRVADLSSGRGLSASGLGPAPNIEPRRRFCPEPDIEPRRVIRPEPRIEPRQVIHPEPRIECNPPQTAYSLEAIDPASMQAICNHRSPIEPPWRVLPWEQPLPPQPVFKIMVKRPDIQPRGRLLNVFG
jgi:hypothetical protein